MRDLTIQQEWEDTHIRHIARELASKLNTTDRDERRFIIEQVVTDEATRDAIHMFWDSRDARAMAKDMLYILDDLAQQQRNLARLHDTQAVAHIERLLGLDFQSILLGVSVAQDTPQSVHAVSTPDPELPALETFTTPPQSVHEDQLSNDEVNVAETVTQAPPLVDYDSEERPTSDTGSHLTENHYRHSDGRVCDFDEITLTPSEHRCLRCQRLMDHTVRNWIAERDRVYADINSDYSGHSR